jgi:Skp family chaperone for outer membrane proteins
MWIIFVVIILIAAIVVVFVYLWKKKKIEKIRSYIIPLGRLVESVKRKEVDTSKLENERDNINRMLTALEREKNEGLISSSSYENMKKSLEEKLDEINKKIK